MARRADATRKPTHDLPGGPAPNRPAARAGACPPWTKRDRPDRGCSTPAVERGRTRDPAIQASVDVHERTAEAIACILHASATRPSRATPPTAPSPSGS